MQRDGGGRGGLRQQHQQVAARVRQEGRHLPAVPRDGLVPAEHHRFTCSKTGSVCLAAAYSRCVCQVFCILLNNLHIYSFFPYVGSSLVPRIERRILKYATRCTHTHSQGIITVHRPGHEVPRPRPVHIHPALGLLQQPRPLLLHEPLHRLRQVPLHAAGRRYLCRNIISESESCTITKLQKISPFKKFQFLCIFQYSVLTVAIVFYCRSWPVKFCNLIFCILSYKLHTLKLYHFSTSFD